MCFARLDSFLVLLANMIPRRLEVEVMDTPDEALDYDAMDHSTVNRVFVDDFLKELGAAGLSPTGPSVPRILDVGTGTALIPLELCTRNVPVRIMAVDAAAHMLQLALKNVVKAGRQEQIRLEQVDAKHLPYGDGEFDAVMSNSIVHHIPEPLSVLREMVRVVKRSGLLFVRDLMRPADEATLSHLVSTHAGDATPHQRQMFDDSLHAALTLDEIRDLLKELGLSPEAAHATSDRHWTVSLRR